MTLAELKKRFKDGEFTQAEYRAILKERTKKETDEFRKKRGYEPRDDQLPSYDRDE